MLIIIGIISVLLILAYLRFKPKALNKLTKGQVIFLCIYPVIHCLLVFGIWMKILFLCNFGTGPISRTPQEERLVDILQFLTKILSGPEVFVMGPNILVMGVIYGFLWVWIYKLIPKEKLKKAKEFFRAKGAI